MKLNKTSRNSIQLPSYQLVAFCVLVYLFFHFVLDFNGLYGQDSHTYLAYSRYLTGEQVPDSIIEYFMWPKLFPALGSIFNFFGIPHLLALQFLSLLSLIGTVLVLKKLIFEIYNQDGSLFILLTAISQIYFVRSGILVMSDQLCVFLSILTFYFFVKHIETKKISDLLLMLIFGVLAFYTRYAAGIILFIPIVYSIYFKLRRYHLRWSLILVFVVTLIIVFNNKLLSEIVYYSNSDWSIRNFFSFESENRDGVSLKTVPNGLYVFGNLCHIGFLSFGILMIPFYRFKRNQITNILFLSVALYLFFLAGMEMQNYRFLVLSHPFVLILLFPSFQRFWSWLIQKKMSIVFVAFVLIVNILFSIYSFRKTLLAHKIELTIVQNIKKIAKNESIYSFYVDQSFTSYGINNKVYNFYNHDYTTFEVGSLVIFNTEKFNEQWKGRAVMRNWNKLNTEYELILIKSLPENWKIYRIN